jgi:hypothetical protein
MGAVWAGLSAPAAMASTTGGALSTVTGIATETPRVRPRTRPPTCWRSPRLCQSLDLLRTRQRTPPHGKASPFRVASQHPLIGRSGRAQRGMRVRSARWQFGEVHSVTGEHLEPLGRPWPFRNAEVRVLVSAGPAGGDRRTDPRQVPPRPSPCRWSPTAIRREMRSTQTRSRHRRPPTRRYLSHGPTDPHERGIAASEVVEPVQAGKVPTCALTDGSEAVGCVQLHASNSLWR